MRRWLLGLGTALLGLIAPASAQAAYNVTISSNPTVYMNCPATGGGTCAPTASGANLNTGNLATALAAGNIAVTTGNSGTEPGTITVEAPVAASGAQGTLTLAPASTLVLDTSNIATGGGQVYAGPVQLNADGTITAAQTTFQSTVDGPYSLTIAGPVTFSGIIGGASALNSLTAIGSSVLPPVVNTTGAQTYDGAVQLDSDVALNSASNGSITFGSTVDGAHSLTAITQGVLEFAGAVGGTTPLVNLATTNSPTAVLALGGNVSVTGSANIEEPVTLLSDVTLGALNYSGITFGYQVTGSHALTIDGNGIVYLGHSDSYTGTVVDGGTLAFTNGALGTGPVTLDGGTLMWWAQTSPYDDPSIQGVTVGGLGGTLDTNGSDVTLARGIAGTGTLTTQTGAGSLTLPGTNQSYGGAIEDQSGTIDLTGSTDTPISVDAGANLNVSGATSGSVGVAANGTLDCAGGTITGAVTNNGGILHGAPAAPTAVSASPGIGSATVSFTPGAANCQPVSYRATADPGGASSSALTAGPLTVTGLVASNPFSFTVTATNPVGSAVSAPSSPISVRADAPTASIAAPLNGATYQLGQVVDVQYSCQDGTGGPGISSCSGPVAPGAALDTATVGTHTFTVTATSGDGQLTTVSASYTVVEDPFTVVSHRVSRTGRILLVLRIPYRGSLTLTESASHARTVTRTFSVAAARTLNVRLGWLKRRGRRGRSGRIRTVHLRIVFTPTGGNSVTRSLSLRASHPRR